MAILRRKQSLSFDEFAGDHDVLSSAEHDLQVAIQAALDVGMHLLAAEPIRAAAQYRDVFPLMGEAGILPKDFASKIAPMASFRNVLVHLYLEVDPRKVYDIVQHHLDDLEQFVEFVGVYVARVGSD